VLAQSQLLLERRRTKDDRESLLVLQESARQALSLVNEFLELSRSEADRMQVQLEPVSLAELLSDLDRTVRGLASSAEVTASVVVAPDLPEVMADVRRLREIVLNLVDSAIKYTPAGGSVRVSATATPPPSSST
jgi:signal transduction histidine kinase